MAKRLASGAGLAIAALLVAGGAIGAEQRSLNSTNDQLLHMTPAARAAKLALAVGNWCVGTQTFLMGVVAAGRGEGNAYWSLRCLDGSAWAVQIDSLGEVTAIDCATLKQEGAGKECFKKF
jgi:hypothetical protein